MKNKFAHGIKVLKLILAYIMANSVFLFLKKSEIWIIQEKNDEARDNAYWLYKYIRENHPEINAYFVINKTGADREKLIRYGEDRIIDYLSFKHYLYSVAAKYNIGSQPLCAFPPGIAGYITVFKKHLSHMPKTVFLQHGVIKDDLVGSLSKSVIGVDFFTTSTDREYEDIKNNYGYKNNEVKLVGMCRFDNLFPENGEENIILVMPTWRKYLYNIRCCEFKETEYCGKYNELLSSDRITKLLEKYNYKIIFYPHYSAQKYVECFEKKSNRIIIADREHYDVQTLMKKSKIMITDFSSVYFDFAYMNKPVVYYQFDKQKFREGHYAEGYFSYEKDGFGPVLEKFEELFDYIELLLENNAAIEDKYRKRADECFAFRDNDNCKRTYEEILKL